jgi:DNA-binding transcriptional MerR regulator
VSPIQPGLRMKELVEATGVPKSTILHYVHEGLLPEPVKTSPNMAYYDPACVGRIRFVQHLQHRHRLSLADIRRVLERDETGAGPDLHLALNDLIFGQDPQGPLDRDEFAQATGLAPERVDELLAARLLLPLAEDRFDAEDVAIGRVYAQGRSLGLKPEDATYYVELGEKIVDHEMAVRNRITRHLPYDQDAMVTMEMVNAARALRAYIIDRLFQHRVAAMRDLKEDES